MNTHTEQSLGHCLVTGAAGFTGSTLVKALLARGLKVRALVRNTPITLEHPLLECFSGDIQNPGQMLEACQGMDTVFHTAANIALMGGSGATRAYREQAYAINVGGTNNVIRACQDAGVQRLIHTSSVDVCFNTQVDMHMDEDTPYATTYTCLYTETKIQAEQAILAANSEQLHTCALRPDGIWGIGGSIMLDTLVEQLLGGKMVARIGGQGGEHDHVHVDNLVHAHLLAADALTPGSPVCGRAYFVSDGEPAPMFDFVKPFFEGLGFQVPAANLPAAPLRWIMTAWQWLHFKLGIAKPLFTPHELNKLVISHVVSSAAARRDFGYFPVISVADGMTECIADYRQKLGLDGSTGPQTAAPAE
jgi:3beta-hydroxy-delta5-steroid dehydrogenase/steroid delta-isomerase